MWTPIDSFKKYYNKAKDFFLDDDDDDPSEDILSLGETPTDGYKKADDQGESISTGTVFGSGHPTDQSQADKDIDKKVGDALITYTATDGLLNNPNVQTAAGAGSTIKDLVDIASPIVQTAAGVAGAIDYNNTMRYMSDQTNATNKAIADQNLGFQRENLDYTKALQQQIFNRQDSSYQRTVADMRAAGMSPLIMNGTNGAGEALATTAMNNQYQHTQPLDYKSPFEAFNGIANILQTREAIRSQRLQNEYAEKTMDYRVNMARCQALASSYDSLDSARKEKLNKYFGINSGMSEKERLACIISKVLGYPLVNSEGAYNEDFTSDSLDKLLGFMKKYKTEYGLSGIADYLGDKIGGPKYDPSKPIGKQPDVKTHVYVDKSTPEPVPERKTTKNWHSDRTGKTKKIDW